MSFFYTLFLDDERSIESVTWVTLPSGPWIIARSYDEFLITVEAYGLPGFVSFDHDLGDGKTGRDCAYWLVDRCITTDELIPDYAVHSMNPVGAENITSIMENGRRMQVD